MDLLDSGLDRTDTLLLKSDHVLRKILIQTQLTPGRVKNVPVTFRLGSRNVIRLPDGSVFAERFI